MANNKKQVRDFIASKEMQYKNEQEFIKDLDAMIINMTGDDSIKNQLQFYKQVRKALMTKDEAIAILEKTFGKQIKPITQADWGGIPVWGVLTKDNVTGYFIVDDHEFKSDTFSFIRRIENRRTKIMHTDIIHNVEYQNMEKLVTATKHYINKANNPIKKR